MRALLFFFKQKTAYEMRISDWSSDVCSSDLHHHRVAAGLGGAGAAQGVRRHRGRIVPGAEVGSRPWWTSTIRSCAPRSTPVTRPSGPSSPPSVVGRCRWSTPLASSRSEEHTSELQSLMRISYAVFCLKKKKKTKQTR